MNLYRSDQEILRPSNADTNMFINVYWCFWNILLRDRHCRPLKKLRISVIVDSALGNLGKGIVKANRERALLPTSCSDEGPHLLLSRIKSPKAF
ncbi:MAG: hypothetical protein GTN80_08340 [Nitrososphaeria archaeon]|nr:hypothetical protein [Nitrososphaeria archaeon]